MTDQAPDLKIIDEGDHFRKMSKTGSIAAAVGIFILVTSLGLSFLLNVNKSNEVKLLSTNNSWAFEKASSSQKAYYFTDITQHLSIFDSLVGSKKIRLVKFRNYYTLTALRDIDAQEDVFMEEFMSGAVPGTVRIRRWKGPNREETVSIDENKYWVRFAAKKGERALLITGADYLYKFPLERSLYDIYCKVVDSNQKVFLYPNDMDYIDNLNIQIDTLGKNISLSDNSAFSRRRDTCEITNPRKFYTVDTTLSQNQRPAGKPYQSVCSWKRIGPGDVAGVIVNW